MVRKIPKLAGYSVLVFDRGNEENDKTKCCICRRVIRAMDDCYAADGIRGGDLFFHPRCAIESGLLW